MRKSLLTLKTIAISMVLSVTAGAQTVILFSDQAPTNGALVLGVFEGGNLGSFGTAIDEASNGGLKHAIASSGFMGRTMNTKVIPAPMGSTYSQIMLVGLGEQGAEMEPLKWQHIGGNAAQKAVIAFDNPPAMVFDVNAQGVANIAYGAKLGNYYFDKYYTKTGRFSSQESLTIVSNNGDDAREIFKAELDPVADAMWYTRDISNEPANIVYPEVFVERWTEHFAGMENVTIKVFDENDLIEMNMGAFYGVGQGSERPPRMMIVEYMGGDAGDNPVLVVGKGITFDTGGISLKNPTNMWNMKFDMSGAASAMGALYAIAGRGAKVNVVGIAALAENMPSANAQRPGDVVTSMSGKTIQIRSTDAEGRLVLADAMYYADTVYNPPFLINMATLTGSARAALGSDYSALFTRHEKLVPGLIEMGKKTGDEVWHMPLNDNHFRAIENNVADVMNSGPSAPGASAGAAFIGEFVREDTNWVHLDIAGIAYSDSPSPTKASPGSRAYGVRLINGYIKEHYERN